MTEDPLGQTYEKGYLGIFILKLGIISVFISIFRRGLRVIYNSDIVKKRDPYWDLKTLKLKLGFFGLFSTPPPPSII